jgi:hypothetical protein
VWTDTYVKEDITFIANPEEGGIIFLRNAVTLLQDHMVSLAIKPKPEQTELQKIS